MDELYAILLSWAVTLSGLPAPDHPPAVMRVPHDFLVRAACNGRECKVMGWFPPGNVIYLDERLDPERDIHASSVVVHEMVHYLQYLARDSGVQFDCESTIDLERSAYHVQQSFLVRSGVYHPVGASMHQVGCELTAR